MFESFDRYTSIIATTAEWAATDFVLKNGEFGIEVLSGGSVKLKAGDGLSAWSARPYIDISSVTINSATQAALDAKLPLAGGTLTGALVLAADPSTALGAATKQYVDAINSGITTSLAAKLDLAGGTLTGFLNLHANPTSGSHAANKTYVDAGDAAAVQKSGSTMTGTLVLAADPANAMEAATKQYVDAGAYQTVVGGSSSYAGKVVKLNSNGFLDTSIVPILSTYIGTINLTASYALTAVYTVGSYFSVLTTGTIDASWNTKINGAPSSCGAGQFLIFNLNGKWDLVGDATSSTSIASKLDKSGGTMTGFITLSADPTSALHAATKQYADTKLPLSGGTLTGALTLAADPAANLQPATKQYVDTANALAALKANNLSDLANAGTALTNLGGTTVGKALFTTTSASTARGTLGSTAVGDALFVTASASAARSTLGAAASGTNTDITSVTLANTGLRVNDTDASNTLSIVPSSNLTVNRTLSIATGDADRTLDISAGSVTITAAGAAVTGAASASAQRTALGLAIGTNVQAWDGDLDAIAALAGTSGILKKTAANTWTLDTTAYAPLASPALTGTPTAPTATAGTNTTQLATTAFVAAAVSGVSGTGRLLRAPQVLTSGTSYTTPAGCNAIYVEQQGAGGGGGQSTNAGTGGGGGGAYCATYFSVSPSTAYSYAIGAGGSAGTAGGNTTFTVGATTVTAGGGGGSTGANGGSAGTGTNGNINIAGGGGNDGFTIATTTPLKVCNAGGASMFGKGGPSGSSTGTLTGSSGTGYGGGGSGGTGGNAGGSGSAGVIRIWEYA